MTEAVVSLVSVNTLNAGKQQPHNAINKFGLCDKRNNCGYWHIGAGGQVTNNLPFTCVTAILEPNIGLGVRK